MKSPGTRSAQDKSLLKTDSKDATLRFLNPLDSQWHKSPS